MIYFLGVIIILLGLFLHFKNANRKIGNLPPGPYQWPLIGSVPQIVMADAKFPHRALAKLSQKYGNVMGLGSGVHYTGI